MGRALSLVLLLFLLASVLVVSMSDFSALSFQGLAQKSFTGGERQCRDSGGKTVVF